MQPGTQSDTLEFSERLFNLRRRLHIARLACEGLPSDDGGGSLIANMIFEVEEELNEISRKLAMPCETGVDHIRQQVEHGIAGLIRQRESGELKDEFEQGTAAKPSNEDEQEGSNAVQGYAAMA